MGKGSGKSSRSSVKMWGSGTSLSRFELENCGAPERAWYVLSLKMRISGTAANPRRCRTLAFGLSRPWRRWTVEIKEILKIMVSGTAKSAKKCKWWCSGTDFLVICENNLLQNGNSGRLSRGTYPIFIHNLWNTPPPGGGGGGLCLWLLNFNHTYLK